jgi:hypothetical protein
VRIDLPSGSQNQCTESVINAHNEKVEDFLVDPDGSIHFLTDKGMIRSLTDPNLQINCAEGQNPVVNYWNKLIRVGDNSFLAAGYCNTLPSNTLVQGEYAHDKNTLNIPSIKSTCILTAEGYPVLRMLEIKSEKYKDLSYVLAAEYYCTIHLLIVRTGENQSIQLKESKNVSSSRRIFT